MVYLVPGVITCRETGADSFWEPFKVILKILKVFQNFFRNYRFGRMTKVGNVLRFLKYFSREERGLY